MNDEWHNIIEDPVDPYDAWVDDILCSEDFQNCTSKDYRQLAYCSVYYRLSL